ncbi:ankyrin and armadillo repeat-containing protein [Megalops cyprinoides]|uniref:ankyrin and armadillo repeat-containing protein n=1 Tax=Megalops cyprinoides TaxID=118141 RepID=UPI0018655E9D|nr:ankyrin and armadillo repeat-containing protein [Megalops cyprinoides]
MARSFTSSTSSNSQNCGEEKDDSTHLSALAAQRNANAFFEKYDRREIQELLSLTSCSWLLSSDDFKMPVEFPPGIIKQMKNFSHSNAVILAPADPRAPLDYKVVQQIIRELTIGIYCFNQTPFLSLEPNYDKSTSCQLTPAYYDTMVGQMLVNIDYTMKALWHGAFMPAEKRVRFSELWRSSMGVDANGAPQTKKDVFAEFLTAGLMDISEDPCYQGIYDEGANTDPTYEPNSPEEEKLFSQHSDSILLKLTAYLTSCQQHENLFVFESGHTLASAVRLTEDRLELALYQRLQQRLALHEALVSGCLQRRAETCRNLAYLRLIAFLVPFLVALKKKMKIPDVSQMLPAFSGDKLKTERELPPLLLGPNFTCKHFPYRQDEYFHLHGGIEFDVGTPPLDEVSAEIKEGYAALQSMSTEHLNELLSQHAVYREHFPIPTHELGGKRYHVISVSLGAFYLQANRTQWWEAMTAAVRTLRGKHLPLNDILLHEQFKKTFGYKKAIKCKSVPFGLRAAADRGLSAVFHSLCRRNSPSLLGALDEQGYSLLHHASIHNHTHILCQLATAGISLNQTCSTRVGPTGQLPLFDVAGTAALHLAAQCGSLQSLSCLLALQADCRLPDRRGWMAVHFASYYGQVACIRALCRKDPALAEIRTAAEYRTSPLLLAAASGSVQALDCLLSLGADWRQTDSEGNSAVHLAALYFHTRLLQHLLQLQLQGLCVWTLLIEMLQSERRRRVEMAVRCMEALCVTTDTSWKDIMDAGGIPALLGLLRGGRQVLHCVAVAVLCHMSQRAQVCERLVQCGAVPVLLGLLQGHTPELHSRCAVILADLAAHSAPYQALIAQLDGVAPVVRLLGSHLQDVLLNTVRCVRALCAGSPANQSSVAEAGGIPQLVELLTISSEMLQEEACAALAELARGHRQNQDAMGAAGAVGPLVQILQGRRLPLMVKAAMALETIADQNPAIQARFLRKSAARHLLRLLKVFQLEVREQGAVSLWALGGQTLKQKRLMAEQIGYRFILHFLLSSSDKMQYVGCQAVIALTHDSRTHQDGLCKEKGVPPLVRVLRGSRTTQRTLLSVLRALASLCIGAAHTSNSNSQRVIAEEKAMPTLVELLKRHESLQVKVQAAQTLACVVLANRDLQEALLHQERFTYDDVLQLLQAKDKAGCVLEAGHALSLFAYNSTAQQGLILQTAGVSMVTYEPFLQSQDKTERAKAAFQIVVLARVITDAEQVTLVARGVTALVELLQSSCPSTVKLTAKLLASLAHTRAGIPEAIVTMGAVEHLCSHLFSQEEEVRIACACALGYLTFNRQAHRLLLVKCRNRPLIYDLLREHLSQDAKICPIFTAEFRRQRRVGLPSLSLETNGGPPVPQHQKGQELHSSSILERAQRGTALPSGGWV